MSHGFVVTHVRNIFTNVKDSHGWYKKAVIRVKFLSQKSLSDLEQAKLSEVNPLDRAKVSANVKKCELTMYREMVVVELFVFL